MIDEIKHRLTIPMLSRELFPDWEPAKSCRSPFRPDHSPSFSVYNDGKLFMDFATGDKGDVIDFYALAKGVSACRKQQTSCGTDYGAAMGIVSRRQHPKKRRPNEKGRL